jgi:sigma-70-like protein
MQNEGGEIVELKRPAPAKGKRSELSARTDDPVRMYLREMGSVELLSREVAASGSRSLGCISYSIRQAPN